MRECKRNRGDRRGAPGGGKIGPGDTWGIRASTVPRSSFPNFIGDDLARARWRARGDSAMRRPSDRRKA
eukprot:4458328-Prymnesium_polylepis.1